MRKSSGINVGSIEEDIRNLEKYIELVIDKNYCDCNELNIICYGKYADGSKNVANSIQNILQDYTRQKQINEEHKKINGELREKVKKLEKNIEKISESSSNNEELIEKLNSGETFTVNQLGFIKKNFIPKQKIKDKIEKLKDKLKFIVCSEDCNKCFDKEGKALYRGSNFMPCFAYHQIKILQELLKESEE